MANIFTTILNMSLTASIIILIVLLARLCLRKAPKIFSYALWSVVLFRLLCPVSFSMPVSLLAPMSGASTSAGTSYTASMEYISLSERPSPAPLQHEHGLGENATPENGDTVPVVTDTPAAIVEQQSERSVGEIVLTILSWLWVAGMAAVLGFTIWQTIGLRRMLADACVIRGNIFESEKIDTAFILGVFSPKIYLPVGLPFDIQKAVVSHEQTHQRRGDHIVKLVSYIALAIHWFNPLVWLSFKLMCDDMEKSCDEAVLREMHNRGYEIKSVKKAYGHMLLALGGGKQHIFSPVSFAENSTKARVKNIVAYNHIARSMGIGLAVACALVGLLCVVNPAGAATEPNDLAPVDSAAQTSTSDDLFTIGNITFTRDVEELDLSEQVIDESAINCLEQCSQLKSLKLYESGVSDLSRIINLPSLEKLDLRYAGHPNYSKNSEQPCFVDFFSYKEICELENLDKLTELGLTIPYRYNEAADNTYISKDDIQYLNNVISSNDISSVKLAVYRDLSEYPDDKRVLVESADYSALVDMNHLTALVFGYDMSDMNVLSELHELTELSLGRGYTSKYGFRGVFYDYTPVLRRLSNLTSLTIWMEDAFALYDYSCLSNLQNLRQLIMNDCCLDHSFLNDLANLSYLHISMSETDREEPVVIDIQDLANSSPELKHLYLSNMYLRNFSSIRQFQQLGVLYLMSTDSDAVESDTFDVSALHELPSLLKLIMISDKEIPAEQVEALEKQVPDCEITMHRELQ